LTPHPYATGISYFGPTSCGTSATCTAVEELVTPAGTVEGTAHTSNAGHDWLPAVPLPGMRFVNNLLCTGTTTCIADGEVNSNYPSSYRIDASNSGGRAWRIRDTSAQGLGTISCPTAQVCAIAGGSSIFHTTNAAATWRATALPKKVMLNDLDCLTTVVCVAVGSSPKGVPIILRSTDGGTTWAVQSTGLKKSAAFYTVSCSSSRLCVLSGTPNANQFLPIHPIVELSTNGGARWHRLSVGGIDDIYQLQCTHHGLCVALGISGDSGLTELIASTNGGQSWSHLAAPPGTVTQSLTCSAQVCVISGSTSDGGNAIEALW
jgi:hypothetical protein